MGRSTLKLENKTDIICLLANITCEVGEGSKVGHISHDGILNISFGLVTVHIKHQLSVFREHHRSNTGEVPTNLEGAYHLKEEKIIYNIQYTTANMVDNPYYIIELS